MTDKVFISYSSRDKRVAEAACAVIEAQGIECWIAPRDLVGGAKYEERLLEAISACRLVVLIFSLSANDSHQVQREIERAVSRKKTIITFRIEEIAPTGSLEYAVSNTHWLDAFEPPLERHLSQLCEDVATQIQLPPSGTLWDDVKSACLASTRRHVEKSPQSIKEKYERRTIQDTFEDFVRSPAKGMFLVGGSGMGKTTLLIRLLTDYSRDGKGDLCSMFESRTLPTGLSQLESNLVKKLGGARAAGWASSPGLFWTKMDRECKEHDDPEGGEKHFLVFIDAVNEFSPGKPDPRPIDLLDQLDQIITDLNTPYSRVKFVVTCRPETWRRATENKPPERFERDPSTYFTPDSLADPSGSRTETASARKKDIAWILPPFSDQEFKGAYERYKKSANIRTQFEDLSPLAVHHLKDPFLLNLAAQAYTNKEIPRDLDTESPFEHFFKELKKSGLDGTIDEIVSEMFVGYERHEAILQTSFPRDAALSRRNNSLYKDLDFVDDLTPGSRLKEQNVIREWKARSDTGDQPVTNIRFTYDRFAEYLLSNRLYRLILAREKARESLPDAAREIVAKSLTSSQNDPIIYGALQRTIFLLRRRSSDYVPILRAISEIDARGQWLVISVLARTARQKTGGIELLAELLKKLGKGKSRLGRRFPVIDSVYRVLRDEDYRLWVEEQDVSVRTSHLSVLYGHFVKAFQEKDHTIWAAAVQYLYFLWMSSSPHAYIDARGITTRLEQSVGPAVGMAFSGRQRRQFLSLGALMSLVLSEVPPERFSDAIEAFGAVVKRLRLRGLNFFASLFLDTFILKFTLNLLDQLPNPIQLDALTNYFESRDRELPIFEEALQLLGEDCDASRLSLETLKRLTCTDQGFTIQLLTFVLSVNYERACTPGARAKALALTRDLFYEEPRSPIAEYCASLAVYHINVFGSNGTQESMELMERMADSILAERQGHLHIAGKVHNFNIIGTYGRALHKHVKSTDEKGSSAMRYVLTSLQTARDTQNPEFYSYICEEIGLLGVLVEPRHLFQVFTTILKDLRAVEEDGSTGELPFDPPQIEKLTDTMLQSLANIRVLYRQQVDKYLLDVLGNPEMYADVATKRDPKFQLSFLISWAFEQLIFRTLVYHYDVMGKDVLQSFLEAMRCHSSSQCVRTAMSALVKQCARLSE